MTMAAAARDLPFDQRLDLMRQIWKTYCAKPIDTTISPEDDMFHREWDVNKTVYLNTGAVALSIIAQAMLSCGKVNLGTILDMPCGFGRVTRHLRAAFPQSKIFAL